MNQPTHVQPDHTQPSQHQSRGAPPGDAEPGSLRSSEASSGEVHLGAVLPNGSRLDDQQAVQAKGTEPAPSHPDRAKKFPLASSLWFVAGVALLLAVLATVPSADGLFYQLPRFWPGTAVALMLIGGAAVLVGELRKRRSYAPASPEAVDSPEAVESTDAESMDAEPVEAEPTDAEPTDAETADADTSGAKDPNGEEIHQPWAHVLIVLAIIAYIAVIEIAGFILATSLLFFAIATIMRAKGLIKVLVISLGVGLVTAYFFGNVLSVPLPRGLGVLTDLSRLIY
jgi:hypothetical protein